MATAYRSLTNIIDTAQGVMVTLSKDSLDSGDKIESTVIDGSYFKNRTNYIAYEIDATSLTGELYIEAGLNVDTFVQLENLEGMDSDHYNITDEKGNIIIEFDKRSYPLIRLIYKKVGAGTANCTLKLLINKS